MGYIVMYCSVHEQNAMYDVGELWVEVGWCVCWCRQLLVSHSGWHSYATHAHHIYYSRFALSILYCRSIVVLCTESVGWRIIFIQRHHPATPVPQNKTPSLASSAASAAIGYRPRRAIPNITANAYRHTTSTDIAHNIWLSYVGMLYTYI